MENAPRNEHLPCDSDNGKCSFRQAVVVRGEQTG